MAGTEDSLPIPVTNGLTSSRSINESISNNSQRTQSFLNNVSDNVNEDDESWLYGGNGPSKIKIEDVGDSALAPSTDEDTTDEMNSRKKSVVLMTDDNVMDSDDDDDQIEVMIRDFKSPSIYQTPKQNRTSMGAGLGGKLPIKGVDLDAQGQINGIPTFEHDLSATFKDDEKPWKKPGADITDYFNYGFTEDTWGQYCDRQRRLRAENNLARINATSNIQHIPQIGGQIGTLVNKQIRPFVQMKKQMGTIDVIGATDQTSRRPTFETGYDHAPMQFMNGPQYRPAHNVPTPHPTPTGPNSSIPDLTTPPPGFNASQAMANVTPNSIQQQQLSQHGTPPQHHQIPTLSVGGLHRLQMPGMSMGPPMLRHPQFGPPPQHPFYGGPISGVMPHERPPVPVDGPYFIPRHQQPWEQTLSTATVGYHFPSSHNPANVGLRSSRSATPEDHSSRSSTPEESREEKSKEDRHKEKYSRDYDRDRRSPKDRYRHREYERSEYERPRDDRDDERRRKSKSRDRDEKYERYPRKRHYREESRHHAEDERYERTSSSHRHRNSQTSHTSTFSSPPKITTSTPSDNNDEQQQASQSSSRHSKGDERDRKHKKSSKRSRHDSEEHERDREKDRGERSGGRSKDENRKISSSTAAPTTQALSSNTQLTDTAATTASNDITIQSKEND
ncbi:unnamed protein product [Didymodactylos carnosus]|uniref:Pre-mRNA polyadenylation factor Fip1 domain-containing protein n=1 Tax=Didymodactylos carnosus TaxID=1234261 RepID=A0A813ZFS6_9BILA|nr:unnamed protein product [Didymodactylos carnosus]CAF1058346.1 unnamed protein product [Didymodactylos carnosus]CAF3681086.1 unnamed protein product [Didymodactylos carnosus]CAF3824225.1 unnamed protein product [Didymodactylos carnosus]